MQKEIIVKKYKILNGIDEKNVTEMENKKMIFLNKLDKSKKRI